MSLIRVMAVAVFVVNAGCSGSEKHRIPQPTNTQQSDHGQMESGQAENKVPIPLEAIWALGMPHTRPMNTLRRDDNNYISEEGPLVDEIRRSIKALPRERNQTPREGFVVVGTGMEALKQAHAILVKDEQSEDVFPEGIELSAVFFSHQAGSYVHLHKVSRDDTNIRIGYRFVPHLTAEVTEHLAIIPLGDLPPGEYVVDIIQSPMKKLEGFNVHDVPLVEARRIVCKPFSFSIKETGDLR